MSSSNLGPFRTAVAWAKERKFALVAAVIVLLCNFYYLDIRYFSALHPGFCPFLGDSGSGWSRFNNSPDAVAIPRFFLFCLLVMTTIMVARRRSGSRSSFVRFIIPNLYERYRGEWSEIAAFCYPFFALFLSIIALATAAC